MELDLGADPEQMVYRGADGLTATMPAALVEQFKINRPYVEETIADNLRPCFARWSFARSDDNLAFLGELNLPLGGVPCYLARGLEDRTGLRAPRRAAARREQRASRDRAGRRRQRPLVPRGPRRASASASISPSTAISPLICDAISAGLRSPAAAGQGRRVGRPDPPRRAGSHARRARQGPAAADGRRTRSASSSSWSDAHRRGAPACRTGDLMDGTGARSPQNAFTPERWPRDQRRLHREGREAFADGGWSSSPRDRLAHLTSI